MEDDSDSNSNVSSARPRIRSNDLPKTVFSSDEKGDARKSVEDCVVLSSDEGYARAKPILLTRYGKPHLVARSHVERLINGSPVKFNDVQGLMNLSLDMEKCSDTPEVFWVEEDRRGKRGEPYAIRSILGWSVIGPTGKATSASNVQVNIQQTSRIQEQIDRLWKTDFPECRSENSNGMSQEDRRALSIMERTLENCDGHYTLGLPWRDQNVQLPNNNFMAVTRLEQLKRKLERDTELHTLYSDTMSGYIEKGYATPLDDAGARNSVKVWYLPLHPVVNQNKPGKLRIVFDCAAKYRGI
ncbi:uncharacterized protein LOC128215438 [Mya arenaria]|uniref:uncharacterized protein LOC128215438 n=1 Tax=Mya arenaria TaxID=6604 RepID=UPI0022E0A02B|nr:uncharacterized protein LOC128215438 [Mya arenaria]